MPAILQIGQIHSLLAAMLLLLALLLCVVVFMLLYLFSRNKREKRKVLWKRSAEQLVFAAIFSEESATDEGDQKEAPAVPGVQKWMDHPSFRQCLIDELVTAKKSLSGDAALNIEKLYVRLHLEKDSEQKLNSLQWYVKARGIQELALMDRKDKVSQIYRHTNNRNEFIRMEAQLAIVQLYALEGLRFLDVVSEPISEWQQIKLLAHLPRAAGETLKGMRAWLLSSNHSVVLFSLKLAAMHHQFDLHNEVAACLEHTAVPIRVQAVKCLREIYNETTPDLITSPYDRNGKAYKEATLEALGAIGAVSSARFLQKELLNEDNSLKLMAARALMKLGGQGADELNSFGQIHQYPWNEIIQQAKSELTA
jgi:hypothetical protein